MTEIPHWWREIFLESGQKLWLVDEVTVFFSAIVYEWQTKGRKRPRKHGESTPKHPPWMQILLLYYIWIWKCGAHFCLGVQIDPSNKNKSNDSDDKSKSKRSNPISIKGNTFMHLILPLIFKKAVVKQKVASVHVNTVNLPQNSHYEWNISFFKRSMWVLLLIVRSQHSSKIYLQYIAFNCFAFPLIQELGIALGFPIEK